MPLVDNFWLKDVHVALEKDNPNKIHKYFYGQKFYSPLTGSPFESIVPKEPDFFGPDVKTLLIISQDYEWNQVYVDFQLNLFKQIFINWSKFRVFIWIDYTLAQQVGPTAVDKMNTLRDHVVATCSEMGDFGWEYVGEIHEGKPASYFQPYIDME